MLIYSGYILQTVCKSLIRGKLTFLIFAFIFLNPLFIYADVKGENSDKTLWVPLNNEVRAFSYRIPLDIKKVPEFAKEPNLKNAQIFRGRLPTRPPTGYIRDISGGKLYIDFNHNGDLTDDFCSVYTSVDDRGHVFFKYIFLNSIVDSVVQPYTIDIMTYKQSIVGWFYINSGWENNFELNSVRYFLRIVDNLDGVIDSNDRLILDRYENDINGGIVSDICKLPMRIFLDGRCFNLEFKFEQTGEERKLMAGFKETHPPMGDVNIEGKFIQRLYLRDSEGLVMLEWPAGIYKIPAGNYKVEKVFLRSGVMSPRVCSETPIPLSVKENQVTTFRIGGPLSNTVQTSFDKNLLRLRYRLLGLGGEEYPYYKWDEPPKVSIYKGPLKVGSGILPFG